MKTMPMPTAQIRPRRHGFADTKPLRFRAELPVTRALPRFFGTTAAMHDFLVPNPRPDLIMDPQTLRMIEP